MSPNLLLAYFLFLNLLIQQAASAQRIWFVDASTGSNANSGLSKSEPLLNIGNALGQANDGDLIYIGAGIYNEQLTVNKRLILQGQGNGDDPTQATIIERATGVVITVNAPLAGESWVELKNLNVRTTGNGTGISLLTGYVALDKVRSRGINQQACQINASANHFRFQASEFHGSNIGLLINDDINVSNVDIWRCQFTGNRTHGLMIRESNPTIAGTVSQLHVRNSVFRNNNPTNINLGHNIYIEKLTQSSFENISIYTPPTNTQNAIDINLKWRQDYENITLRNVKIERATEGVGMFIKGRNDAPLYNAVPGKLQNVNIEGCSFQGCRNNIRFENDVSLMTVNRCDLSNFNTTQGNAIVNLTNSMATLDASHNYFGTPVPMVALGYLANITEGSNVITLNPLFNSNDLTLAQFAFGLYFPPFTIVTEINGNSITLNNAATGTAIDEPVLFNSNTFPAAHIQRAATNALILENPLEFKFITSNNQSFNNLQDALSNTPINGAVFHVAPTIYLGVTTLPNGLTLHTPGAGLPDSSTVATFDNLTLQNGLLNLNMDIHVVTSLINNGQLALNAQNLLVSGKFEGSGTLSGAALSELSIQGLDSAGVVRFDANAHNLRSLSINRQGNGIIVLIGSVKSPDVAIESGKIKIMEGTFFIDNFETRALGSNASIIGEAAYRIAYHQNTFDLHFPTAGEEMGKRNFELKIRQDVASPTDYKAAMVEESSAALEYAFPNNINRVSPKRYWEVSASGAAQLIEAVATIHYQLGDQVNDPDTDNLRILKENTETSNAWEDLGGSASAQFTGSISSTANFTTLGKFTLGNVTGGLNFVPDTIFVDLIDGNDAYNGLFPSHSPGTDNGPKQTINSGIEAVSNTGVVMVRGGYYPERVIFNKRIAMNKYGPGMVTGDTIVFLNNANLLDNLPAEFDFGFNVVELSLGSIWTDAFLMVGNDGVVYLEDIYYEQPAFTAKNFVIKGLASITAEELSLTAGNTVVLGTPFVINGSLNLNAAQGSKVRISDDDLSVANIGQITGVSDQSYIITSGTGHLVLTNLTSGPTTFPVGVAEGYAPVTINDANTSGDAVGVRVRTSITNADFTPALSNDFNAYVQLQWNLKEASNGGHNAALSFRYPPTLTTNGFDGLNDKVIAQALNINWITTAATVGANGVTAPGFNNLRGNFALHSLTAVSIENVGEQPQRVFPNPFNNVLVVSTQQGFEGNIRITAINGQQIFSEYIALAPGTLHQLNTSSLPQGIFLLEFVDSSGNRTSYRKLVKH